MHEVSNHARASTPDKLEQRQASVRYADAVMLPAMHRAEHATAQNEGLQLSVAVSYGGRSDIARAAAEIANLVAQGDLHPSQVELPQPVGRVKQCLQPSRGRAAQSLHWDTQWDFTPHISA